MWDIPELSIRYVGEINYSIEEKIVLPPQDFVDGTLKENMEHEPNRLKNLSNSTLKFYSNVISQVNSVIEGHFLELL